MNIEEKDFISGFSASHGAAPRAWTQRLIDSYALILITKGSFNISLSRKVCETRTKDLILLRPGVRHSFDSASDSELLWFHFLPRPHVTPILKWPEDITGLSKVSLDEFEYIAVKQELEEAHELRNYHFPGWYILAATLLEAALARGYRHIMDSESEVDSSIQAAQELLLKTRNSIDEIALKCGMSRAALYSKFKQATGCTPRQYREVAIIRNAVHLLENSTMNISQIAEQIGMHDALYFSTRFRKYYGMSPRQYRNRLQSL